MALIFKCDRCGEQYEPYDIFNGEYAAGTNGIVQMVLNYRDNPNNLEQTDKMNYIFCEECCKSFNRWLRDKENRKD